MNLIRQAVLINQWCQPDKFCGTPSLPTIIKIPSFFVNETFPCSGRNEFSVRNAPTIRNGHANIGPLVTVRTKKCLLNCGGQMSSKDAQLEDREAAGV
jgi:hypothetical protein